MEEEESSKFDFQTLLYESSKKFKKGKYNPMNFNKKGGFSSIASKNLISTSS